MVPTPRSDTQRASPLLAQRRVKSYELPGGGEPDYDRNRITQFIRQPFPTKPTADELRRTVSAASTSAASARSRPTFSYNDTGSFEEVDEEKVARLLLYWVYSHLTSLLSRSVKNEAITANIGGCLEGLDCVAYVFD